MVYDVPMFDELYMIGCDSAYCYHFGKSTFAFTYF